MGSNSNNNNDNKNILDMAAEAIGLGSPDQDKKNKNELTKDRSGADKAVEGVQEVAPGRVNDGFKSTGIKTQTEKKHNLVAGENYIDEGFHAKDSSFDSSTSNNNNSDDSSPSRLHEDKRTLADDEEATGMKKSPDPKQKSSLEEDEEATGMKNMEPAHHDTQKTHTLVGDEGIVDKVMEQDANDDDKANVPNKDVAGIPSTDRRVGNEKYDAPPAQTRVV